MPPSTASRIPPPTATWPDVLTTDTRRRTTRRRRGRAGLPCQALGRLDSGASPVPFSVLPLKTPSSTVT
jgi:hypothetical protein